MPKRKYVVKYKELQKRFKAVDNSKGWLSRREETWEKVKHNPQALKTKFRELTKGSQTKKIVCQDYFKKHFYLNQELAESDTKSDIQVTSEKLDLLWEDCKFVRDVIFCLVFFRT